MNKRVKIDALVDALGDGTLRETAETKAALLQLPVLQFPEEYGAFVGRGRTACFEDLKAGDFPKTILVGRQRYVRTKAVLDWMFGRESKAQNDEDGAQLMLEVKS